MSMTKRIQCACGRVTYEGDVTNCVACGRPTALATVVEQEVPRREEPAPEAPPPKPPIELIRSDTKQAVGYACASCGTVQTNNSPHARSLALACCAIRLCSCGKPCEKYDTACRDCMRAATWMREAERFCKAEIVDERSYDGPVYDDSRDEYESSVEEMREHLERSEAPEDERPFFVYTCTTYGIPRLSAEAIVDAHLEQSEMHEEAYEGCTHIEELQAALDAWHEKQDVTSWMVDHSRVIVLDEASAAEYRAEYQRRLAARLEPAAVEDP